MKNAYDLTRDWLEILADIDRTLDAKSKTKDSEIQKRLDKEANVLEDKRDKIAKALKNTQIKVII